MINRKKLVDKRLKSMEYWLQYSKEFAEIEQKTHNPDLNMNIAPIRAPSPALYNAWDSSYLHDIDYLVDMMVTEKLLTGYFAERQVLKDWLRLSDVYLYQQITREAKRRKIGNANLDVALCLAASLRQIFKKAKIDDQFVMSDMFVEYDQDADDEDGEEDTFDFGTETVTEVENVFVSAYNLRSKNRV
eukprot:1049662_1